MIVGDLKAFAIDWSIEEVFQGESIQPFGYFNILLNGRRFGVFEPDATMMYCSYYTVVERIENRGQHYAPFGGADGFTLASACYDSIYSFNSPRYFGLNAEDIKRDVISSSLFWAPDGDEAFDDGSFILQFDRDEEVRLIGFRATDDRVVDRASLEEVCLGADHFYRSLEEFVRTFREEFMRKNGGKLWPNNET